MARKKNHLVGQPQILFVIGSEGEEGGKVVNYISINLGWVWGGERKGSKFQFP